MRWFSTFRSRFPDDKFLGCFRELKLPVVVFACKSDLERNVESRNIYSRIKQLDVGLVEVNALEDGGKKQLRLGFDFLLRSIAIRRESQYCLHMRCRDRHLI